jgi:hypothetical protein
MKPFVAQIRTLNSSPTLYCEFEALARKWANTSEKPTCDRANDKGRDHSRPLRFSAWRLHQVRRDIFSLSQGFLALTCH